MAAPRATPLALVRALVLMVLMVLAVAPPPAHAAAVADDAPVHRARRFLFGLLGGPSQPCGQCPLHHCSIEPAIVHGYCCGCARWLDRVPIRCPPQLTCPLHGEALCADYNYMMDCCC